MMVMWFWKPSGAAHPRVEEQIDVFVKEGLVLLVPCTEVLQELVGQFHYLLHADVLPLDK